MEIKLNNVEEMLEVDAKAYDSSKSAHIYIPKKFAGRQLKLIVMKMKL